MSQTTVYPNLVLSQWNGVTPVILPIGPQTLSCIGSATTGVAVPFFLFLVAMFYLLIPIWLYNSQNNQPKPHDYEAACKEDQCTSNDPGLEALKYNPRPPSTFLPGQSILLGEASTADLMQMGGMNYTRDGPRYF
jgi:hypothetical protein